MLQVVERGRLQVDLDQLVRVQLHPLHQLALERRHRPDVLHVRQQVLVVVDVDLPLLRPLVLLIHLRHLVDGFQVLEQQLAPLPLRLVHVLDRVVLDGFPLHAFLNH